MADQSGVVAACALIVAVTLQKGQRMRRKRRVWTREWILGQEAQGAFHQLMQEIRAMDTYSYTNFVRMDASTFEELLSMIAPRIEYQDTVMRQAVLPAERLAVTLRFLATGMSSVLFSSCTFTSGETFQSLQYLYRIPSQTIGQIIPETCHAIVDVLADTHFKVREAII